MSLRPNIVQRGRNLSISCPDCAATRSFLRLIDDRPASVTIKCACGFTGDFEIRLRDPYTPGHGLDVRRTDLPGDPGFSCKPNNRAERISP